MNDLRDWIRLEKNYIIPTYKRQPVVFVRGKGKYLWDKKGKRYLDFFAGLSVCNLGHCHPKITRAVKPQIDRLIHVSNIYYMPVQINLAGMLISKSFGRGKVFFSNSGAEADECAIKIARKWGKTGRQKPRYEIIAFKNSFHGRTLATLAATGQKKLHKGFEPLVRGFKYARFNDIQSVKKLVSSRTCAVIIEPIQGEGGVYPANRKFLDELRKLCNAKKLLLIFDEIQSGLGRTGKLFAYQYYNVKPDIITLAKSISNGFPLGATLVSSKFANILSAGDHGSTFGGNIISCTAAIEVLNLIDNKLLKNVERLSKYFFKQLSMLKTKHSVIKEIRGKGLMIGLELSVEGKDIIKECLENGLILNCIQKKIIRFLPPFIITREDIDKAVNILDSIFQKSRLHV